MPIVQETLRGSIAEREQWNWILGRKLLESDRGPVDLDLTKTFAEFCVKHWVRSETIRFEQRSNKSDFYLRYYYLNNLIILSLWCSNNIDLLMRLPLHIQSVILYKQFYFRSTFSAHQPVINCAVSILITIILYRKVI